MATESRPPEDAADLAAAALDRAIGRLIALLGCEDPALGRKAMLALMRLGPEAAIAHLGAALGRQRKDPLLRRRIASAVAAFGQLARGPAASVLIDLLRVEEDPDVAQHAGIALADLGPFPRTPDRAAPAPPAPAGDSTS